MGIHVIKSTTAPTVAPTVLQVGAHWVKTTNPKGQWFAVGSDTLADWVDQSAIAGAVARTGDTMTGPLKVPQTLSTDDDDVVATKKYVDDNAGGGDAYALVSQGGGVSLVGVSLGGDLGVKSLVEGTGVTIVGNPAANTVTISASGGGGGGETLNDISESGWTVLGTKTGSTRDIYGLGVGSGLYLDQPGNDLLYYNQGMNGACLPVLTPSTLYCNRLVPNSQDNSTDVVISTFGVTSMFPIFIDSHRRPTELYLYVKSLGGAASVQMRVAVYESDPETNTPHKLWSSSTRLVESYEEDSTPFTPVSFDIAADATSSKVPPGIYWVLIWAPDTANVTLHAVPKDHANAFGERNHAKYSTPLADHTTPLEPEMYFTQNSDFGSYQKVPLIRIVAGK